MKLVHVVLAVEVPDEGNPDSVAYLAARAIDNDVRVVSATHSQAVDDYVATEAESARLEEAKDELRHKLPDAAQDFRAAQEEYLNLQELRAMRRNHLPRLLLRELAGGGTWRAGL